MKAASNASGINNFQIFLYTFRVCFPKVGQITESDHK